MSSNRTPNESESTPIGDFSPPDADRFLSALTHAGIPFQIECDDGTYYYSPAHAPRWGTGVKIRVFVEPDNIDDAEKLKTKLFGDWRP